MTLRAAHAGLMDRGRRRHSNEDCWCAQPAQGIYVIADGIGGGLSGGLAARIVVQTLPALIVQRLGALDRPTQDELADELSASMFQLSQKLRSESQGELGLEGMGATVVVAVIRPTFALIGHLGDSRAYLLRRDSLSRLTSDHTLVQLLFDTGRISAEDAAGHPGNGRLTRFVGMPGEPLPEVQAVELVVGDVLLLCSDGLTGMLADRDIQRLLHANTDDLVFACQRLVESANQRGGEDNISVLAIRFDQELPAPERVRQPTGLRGSK